MFVSRPVCVTITVRGLLMTGENSTLNLNEENGLTRLGGLELSLSSL